MPPKSKSSTVDNDALEHTRGGATTRDGMDAGVPMTPGQANEPVGPEDALGPGPKRGDYRDRLVTGPPMVTRVIPEDERQRRAEALATDGLTAADALAEVPMSELVRADEEVGDVGDAPGKGGVSTAEALEENAALAGLAGASTADTSTSGDNA